MSYLLFIFLVGGMIYNYRQFSSKVFLGVTLAFGILLVPNSFLFWVTFIPVSFLILVPELRREYITSKLVDFVTKNNLLPQISKTEEEALHSGTKWVAEEFFSGQPNFSNIYKTSYNHLSSEEKVFLETKVDELCAMTSDNKIFQDKDLSPEVWEFLKKEKFFGMIIPKEFGGLGFSALGHSAVIEKLVSRSQVLAITTMVPNSLGPAELLTHYGTESQKEKYLEKLAVGEEIPCFGLTEPLAGSDAASIQSFGEVTEVNGEIKILLNYEKRYITLGNIATLIGLAFRLRDPKQLLGRGEDLGITFAIFSSELEGVDSSRRHDPLGVPFYNSHLKGVDVEISMENIIGEEDGIGKGWLMLMESLSVGRGISLPSTSLGASKLATRVVAGYTVAREQFGLNIGKFEGVAEELGKIAGLTYMQRASKKYVLDAIDSGEKPAVINSVMKYHATENSREVIKSAMDVVGGAGIIKGEKNLLANLYTGAPISITVEGANILTRNLMQFGQGVIRCHPYIKEEIEALKSGSVDRFDNALFSHISLSISNMVRGGYFYLTRANFVQTEGSLDLKRYEQKVVWASAFFSLFSDIALGVFGGGLKKKESISAKLADVFSHLYLASSVLREYKENQKRSELHSAKWALEYSMYEVQKGFESVLENLFTGFAGKLVKIFLLTPFRLNPIGYYPSDELSQKLTGDLLEDEGLKKSLTEGIYLPTDKEEQLNIIDRVHTMVLETKPLVDRVKKAAKDGKIPMADFDTMVVDALEAGIIISEEEEILSRLKDLKYAAITVDSVDVKEYFKQR